MGTKKNFVLDTNVILHDYKCIYNFEENDVYIPITVLEELDKFKKGNDQINFNAREFVRELDSIVNDGDIFQKGISLGSDKGRLFVLAGSDYPEELAKAFSEKIPDHIILAAAYNLGKKHKEKTILVTKDVNLRLKARSLNVLAEDYISDKITNIEVYSSNTILLKK